MSPVYANIQRTVGQRLRTRCVHARGWLSAMTKAMPGDCTDTYAQAHLIEKSGPDTKENRCRPIPVTRDHTTNRNRLV